MHMPWGRRGRDRMVVGFANTYAIGAYYKYSFEFESRSWRGVLVLSVACFLRALRFPPPIKLTATI